MENKKKGTIDILQRNEVSVYNSSKQNKINAM